MSNDLYSKYGRADQNREHYKRHQRHNFGNDDLQAIFEAERLSRMRLGVYSSWVVEGLRQQDERIKREEVARRENALPFLDLNAPTFRPNPASTPPPKSPVDGPVHTLLYYTNLDWISNRVPHTVDEIMPRLRNPPAEYFREDGSLRLEFQWMIYNIGYAHFQGGHGCRAFLKNYSWIRTEGVKRGIPRLVVLWLCGDLGDVGFLELSASVARTFFRRPE